jgi:hypothetical protein
LMILIILAKRTSYGASHPEVFFTLLQFHPSLVQILSSAPFSNTLSLRSSLHKKITQYQNLHCIKCFKINVICLSLSTNLKHF